MDSNQPIPVENLSYSQALAELESIVATLQSSSCDIDALVDLTRRAAALLALCRSRLVTTEQQLRDSLAALQTPEA